MGGAPRECGAPDRELPPPGRPEALRPALAASVIKEFVYGFGPPQDTNSLINARNNQRGAIDARGDAGRG
ncbi:hypothetical protein MicB006_1537 [Micromonospora sp. B006]|nr:hypothetical protein MicB006_1537 [Micromonospora sp. B006]